MFSNSTKYAIKATLYLALHSNEDNKVMAREIANPINAPLPYLAKLLQKLSNKNLINSVKGHNGGFYLNESNRNNTLMDLIVALNDGNNINSCLLSLDNCNEQKPCPLHNLVFNLRTSLLEALNSKSIAEIAVEIEEGCVFLPL